MIELCWAQWVWFESIDKTWDKFDKECRGEHEAQVFQKPDNFLCWVSIWTGRFFWFDYTASKTWVIYFGSEFARVAN